MTLNTATLDLICSFEGFVDHWYPDPAHGWKVPTCCYGHTDAAGPPPKFAETKDQKFSELEGRTILARDLEKVIGQVRGRVRVELNENELGALVSFTFNVGIGNFGSSTLLRKLNSGDRSGAAAQFARWNKAGGKTLRGLTRRREAERVLFLTPVTLVRVEPKAPDAPSGDRFAQFVAWIRGVFS